MKPDNPLILLVLLFLDACGQFDVNLEPISTTLPTLAAESPTPMAIATAFPTEQVTALSKMERAAF
jgi:hypothetical protein